MRLGDACTVLVHARGTVGGSTPCRLRQGAALSRARARPPSVPRSSRSSSSRVSGLPSSCTMQRSLGLSRVYLLSHDGLPRQTGRQDCTRTGACFGASERASPSCHSRQLSSATTPVRRLRQASPSHEPQVALAVARGHAERLYLHRLRKRCPVQRRHAAGSVLRLCCHAVGRRQPAERSPALRRLGAAAQPPLCTCA